MNAWWLGMKLKIKSLMCFRHDYPTLRNPPSVLNSLIKISELQLFLQYFKKRKKISEVENTLMGLRSAQINSFTPYFTCNPNGNLVQSNKICFASSFFSCYLPLFPFHMFTPRLFAQLSSFLPPKWLSPISNQQRALLDKCLSSKSFFHPHIFCCSRMIFFSPFIPVYLPPSLAGWVHQENIGNKKGEALSSHFYCK